ncbi:Plancitoxin-1 [Trichinella sp. T8]|nr:Plancitoxin-1 [Trichinella sp. T8]
MNCFVESKYMLIFLLIFPNPIAATSKCRTQNGVNFYRAILYKAAGRNDGRIITAENGAWQQSPQPVGNRDGHSFGKALEHVAVADQNAKFVAYNNKPPNAVGVQTNSNSKGILIMDPTPAADSAAWIIHTVPGFPKALQAYTFPAEEIAKGHLFVCLTIKEEQLDVIAHALRIARPLVYHQDIPATEVNSRPNLKNLLNGDSNVLPPLTISKGIKTAASPGIKTVAFIPGLAAYIIMTFLQRKPNLKNLLNGDSSVLPPLTISKEIKATGNPGIKATVFSKGEKSGYEMFKRVLSRKLKKDLKVWTTRDTKLKSDCRILGRNIKLITSPISVSGDESTLENDVSQWAVTEPGNVFCAIDKPYHKSQRKEPALAVCIDDATIFTRFNELITGWSCLLTVRMKSDAYSFGKALEHVAVVDQSAKFVAYNNKPPNAVGVQTNSNSKGILIMDPRADDSAAWIIHTVPGFPKALQAYTFPAEEIAKGHLFVCLTIKEEQLDVIAHALRIVRPLVYHHDIPATEVNSRPNLKNLLNGDSSVLPPLTISKGIKTAASPGIKATVFSKGEKSGYEMFKRVLSRKLKKDLKVWTTRDTKLKGDCRILGRNIKLITSPISVSGDASTLENDVSQWAVTEPGSIFCAIDKPYHKSQKKEPALAVCIDDATIFARFNDFVTASVAWQQSPAQITVNNRHSFGKALEHVAVVDQSAKFVAYNNKPPNAVGVQTNSNSKAHALRIVRPLVYHHDIPATEVNSRPNLKNLLNGDSSVLPPLTISKGIKTAASPGIKATVFSKGEKSGYEMFKRVLSRKLKKDLKVWTTRDTKLKGDCRILGRNIKLITSPISVSGDASTLENDVSQWAVTEPGSIFCAIDKPYHKSQKKEPALAVCIDDATIFARFNDFVTGTDACTLIK